MVYGVQIAGVARQQHAATTYRDPLLGEPVGECGIDRARKLAAVVAGQQHRAVLHDNGVELTIQVT